MAYIYDLADTWNNAAVTYTAIKMNVTNSASSANSRLISLSVNGNLRFDVDASAVATLSDTATRNAALKIVSSDRNVTLKADADGGNGNGLIGPSFYRVASNGPGLVLGSYNGNTTVTYFRIENDAVQDTLVLRNYTNAQTFRIYNTYTDASNYERAKLEWSSNVLRIGTEKLGTGSARALELQTDGVTRLTISSTGNVSGKQIYTPTQTLTDGVTISWDALQSAAAEVTLTGSGRTITPSNLVAGGTYLLFVKQDATGGRTVTTWTNFRWPGGFAPTLSTAANAVDIITGVSDGTYIYASAQTGFA